MSPSQIKRIGILTGGGDCPGLNAVIRAVAKTAMLQHGIQVFGIEDGFQGLIEDRVHPLSFADVSGILTRGGTILGTNNKCNPRKWAIGRNPDGSPVFADCTQQCIATVERHGLDAIVVIGGDGTMAASTGLVDAGINIIGVPKTIDNDLHGTEITFGFLTAVATATEALDKLHSTADSHHRVMVCEVMGRNAGWIALHGGLAGGADIILIPEIPFDHEKVAAEVLRRESVGAKCTVIVVAEGARTKDGRGARHQTASGENRLGGIGEIVGREVGERTGKEVRTCVLGHLQRGGAPTMLDRILGTSFGVKAVQLAAEGKFGSMVSYRNHEVVDVPIADAVHRARRISPESQIVAIARAVEISFGD